ncbi:MAG: hypothetical protein ACREK1_02500, partial [Longimicrobiales bacterium]
MIGRCRQPTRRNRLRQLRAQTAVSVLPRCLVVASAVLTTACTRQYMVSDTGPQAYYQTGFPIRDTSGELARIAQSIHRLGVTSFYTTYRFAGEDSVRDADIRSPATLARAREQYVFDHS